MTNPTHNPDEYSSELLQEKIRPELETYLDTNFSDPVDRSGSKTPPLVVTALPEGGNVAYPHVVVAEQDDSAEPPDPSQDLMQHDFSIEIEIHGRSTTQMFNLRGYARGWFLRNRDELRDVGLAELNLSGNSADWDATSKTSTWQLTVTGLVHTHPDSNYTVP